jgi:regulation of enolase protein 1 (concanavalin A-like superfamily)
MSNLSRWKGFSGPHPGALLSWQNEPARWALVADDQRLRLEPEAGTDFWQKTHYGFRADNGHFLYADVAGDVVMTTHVRMQPAHQYDQAGLMVRLSATCWLKASVEHEPGRAGRLGAVFTNQGYSDWSTQPFTGQDFWLRVRREGGDYIVDASPDGAAWEQVRLAHLHEDDAQRQVACGLYACSPKGAGFAAEFSQLRIEAGRVGSPA